MTTAELMSAVNFVDYAENCGVELQYKNGEWWGLSPFKAEKTPSFSINEEKQSFYDFSSGRGGNLIQFVMDLHGCSLSGAVKELMRYAGISEDKNVCYSNTPEILKIAKRYKPSARTRPDTGKNEILPDTYMELYENRPDKLKVWTEEGMTPEILEKFQVRYDPFQNRLVFPIRDYDGHIVNICGRTLEKNFKEKGLRKYTYYKKWCGGMDVIFGYTEHSQAFYKNNEIILFEGAKSVFLAETWGFENTGALLTSHLSDAQFRRLIKLGVHVTFALDEDVNVAEDKNIQRLKRYCGVFYIRDTEKILDEKMSPVDKGPDVWKYLYERRLEL